MSKLSFALLIVAATILSTANGDLLGDLLSLDQSIDFNSLDVLKILLNPKQPFELKVAELILNRALNGLAQNGDGINLKLDKANTLDMGQVFIIDADLTDSQKKVQKCKVTIWIHYINNVTDFTFDCNGLPSIVKHVQWKDMM